MPLTKINRERDPYEDAFAKARDIRLKRARSADPPRFIIATSSKERKANVSKSLTH